MEGLPSDWTALCAVIFLLGVKHGFDADHLATIDGLTRFNARARPRLAARCGMLFSLGHGAVVIAVALATSGFAHRWQVPGWLEVSGAWISVALLTALGAINLRAVFSTPAGTVVQTVPLKGRWLGRLQRSSDPLSIAAVGALFALSFDTFSQAVLFAVAGARFGGAGQAAILGTCFMAGMLATDGINGWWISRLIRRTDRIARRASRVMTLAVAGASFAVAGFEATRYCVPALDAWSQGRELGLGIGVIAVMASAFLLALALARPLSAARSGRA
jgi:high-affinity nickel-transport protein